MAMASSATSWLCQLCEGRYATLFNIVSHVRAAHSSDPHMNLVCAVNECHQTFHKATSWYRHVRIDHSEIYYSSNSSCGFDIQYQESDALESSNDMGLSHEVHWDVDPTDDPESSDETAFPGAMQSSSGNPSL